IRDQIMTSLWYAFRRHNIEIPFPVRTLYVHDAARAAQETSDADEVRRERLHALRQVDFLQDLGDDEIGLLLLRLRAVAFGGGEVICREGDVGEQFFILRRGTVEVVTHGTDGGVEAHIANLAAPAFFGEMALLTGEPRSATVRAKGDIELLVVDRDAFQAL